MARPAVGNGMTAPPRMLRQAERDLRVVRRARCGALIPCIGPGMMPRYQRVEVITGRRRRRDWSDDEKARILGQSADPEVNISEVARRSATGSAGDCSTCGGARRGSRRAKDRSSCNSGSTMGSGRRGAAGRDRAVLRCGASGRTDRGGDRRRDGARARRRRRRDAGARAGGGEVTRLFRSARRPLGCSSRHSRSIFEIMSSAGLCGVLAD